MSDRTGARWGARCIDILHGRLWWLVAVPVLLLAAYVVVARQLMLLVPDYRQDLERLVEQRFGVAIHVDRLSGHMDGLTPRFKLQGLTLPAEKGDSALKINKVMVSVSVLPTLLHRQPYLSELRIDGIDVQLVRDADGHVHLRGLEALRDRSRQGSLADALHALYRQKRIVIQNARFSLDWPGLPPLAASSLTLELVNSSHHHSLAVRVQARDRPFSVDARLSVEGDPVRWRQLNARGYLDVSGKRLQEWLPQQRQWPLDVSELDGRVRLWGRIDHGRPRAGTVRLAAPKAVLTDGHKQWPLSNLNLDAAVRRGQNGGGRIAVSSVHVTTPAGALAPGPVALRWRHHGEQWQWQFYGEDLALHSLSRQFLQWPFFLPKGAAALRDRVREQAPRGVLGKVYLSGTDGDIGALQARFAGLASQAHDKTPGVSGLSGWLAATPDGGVATISGEPLQLTLPGLYDHPLSMTLRQGPLRWYKAGGHWRLQSGVLAAHNSDARGVALFQVDAGEGIDIPELRLLADIRHGNGARAAHYIPLVRLPVKLSTWLAQAFRGGVLDHGQFLYRGPVHIDPARQQDRTFQMRFQGHDISLSFLPGWPLATGVRADVLIDGRRLIGSASRGTLFNSDLSDVSVTIPEVADRSLSHIVIDGQVNGPAADLDQLFHDTPLQAHLPDELLNWRFQGGRVAGHLTLDMPLVKDSGRQRRVTVNGSAENVELLNQSRRLQVTNLTAPVTFDLQKGINLNSLEADILGGHFGGSWNTDNSGSHLRLNGSVPVDKLRGWLGFDWLRPVSGTLPLDLTVNLPWHGAPFSLQGNSSLKGVKVAAPAPLGKAAAETRPSQLTLSKAGANGDLDFRYGHVGRGHLSLGQPLTGGLRFGPGAPPPAPPRGLDIEGRVGQLDAARWLDFITGLLPARPAPAKADAQSAAHRVAPLLHRVELRVGRLDLFGLNLNQARFFAAPGYQDWSLGLNSPSVAGTLSLPAGYRARGETPLTLNISRLHLPKGMLGERAGRGSQGGADKAPPIMPDKVPIMNVEVKDLRIGDETLGNWAGRLRPRADGVSVTDLRGQWRHVSVQGRLDWTGNDSGQQSHFTGSLDSSKLGDAFKAWGLPVLLETKDAHAKADLSWNNWPLKPDYTDLHGTTKVDIGECRIPDTDSKTSGLRLLGVFNVGTLQRRLRLDFSDLYKKGLSCDSIKGDLQFDGPTLSTSNLEIQSPSAAFSIKGHANLARQTLDQQVEMTLPISSNLYAGCIAGPAVCAGIFVVERIWGDKLDKTTTMTYQVSGPWKDPKVKETEGMFE